MGFHATIAAGTDQFGNTRHKMAPRVRATERVTGTAQQRKFHELAGNVKSEQGSPDFSDASMALALAIADRRVTDMTYRMSDYRKEGSKWVLNMRSLGGRIVARNVITKDFHGWVAEFMPYTGGRVSLVKVAKGSAIEHNGESSDCRRIALVKLHSALIKIASR